MVEVLECMPDTLDDFDAGMGILRWIASRRDAIGKIGMFQELRTKIAIGAMMRQQQRGQGCAERNCMNVARHS